MTRRVQLDGSELEDDVADRVRVTHAQAIQQMQGGLFFDAKLIKDVTLANGVDTPISHGLGRAAFVIVTPARGTDVSGTITETRSATWDRKKFVVLHADGFTADPVVDVVVF